MGTILAIKRILTGSGEEAICTLTDRGFNPDRPGMAAAGGSFRYHVELHLDGREFIGTHGATRTRGDYVCTETLQRAFEHWNDSLHFEHELLEEVVTDLAYDEFYDEFLRDPSRPSWVGLHKV